ncbi:unnamed protein product [Schistocephalus solidus]|uniref:Uncharacterized protein n=1 Tax=Schistocephalus solidus TaxID=70667 RepID=A0A183TI17_SCHSO|nr:unnamed protein product [Schistocephalus solidus]
MNCFQRDDGSPSPITVLSSSVPREVASSVQWSTLNPTDIIGSDTGPQGLKIAASRKFQMGLRGAFWPLTYEVIRLSCGIFELTLGGGSTLQSSDINGGLTPQRSLSVGPKPTSEAEMGRQSLLRLPEDVNLRSKPESPYRDINY